MTTTLPAPQLTPQDVHEWTKEAATSAHVQRVTHAVNVYVAGLPVVEGLTEWPADVRLGALMLAARLVKRRNSPNGVEAATDLNVTYTARYDADIARLLRLDASRKPQVG